MSEDCEIVGHTYCSGDVVCPNCETPYSAILGANTESDIVDYELSPEGELLSLTLRLSRPPIWTG